MSDGVNIRLSGQGEAGKRDCCLRLRTNRSRGVERFDFQGVAVDRTVICTSHCEWQNIRCLDATAKTSTLTVCLFGVFVSTLTSNRLCFRSTDHNGTSTLCAVPPIRSPDALPARSVGCARRQNTRADARRRSRRRDSVGHAAWRSARAARQR